MPSCSSTLLPKNWPKDIIYLPQPKYSPQIPSDIRSQLQIPKPTNLQSSTKTASSLGTVTHLHNIPILPVPRTPSSSLVRILPILNNPSHPANNQSGLYATMPLLPNSLILTYHGFVHTCSESDTDPTSDYDLSLDRDLQIGIDAKKMGNEARFINDYRGVSLGGPNAEFRDVWVEIPAHTTSDGKVKVLERRVGVFVLSEGKGAARRGGNSSSKHDKSLGNGNLKKSLRGKEEGNGKGSDMARKRRARGIAKGEEILVSYGKGFWGERKEVEEEMQLDPRGGDGKRVGGEEGVYAEDGLYGSEASCTWLIALTWTWQGTERRLDGVECSLCQHAEVLACPNEPCFRMRKWYENNADS